jgi:hypothetical protein
MLAAQITGTRGRWLRDSLLELAAGARRPPLCGGAVVGVSAAARRSRRTGAFVAGAVRSPAAIAAHRQMIRRAAGPRLVCTSIAVSAERGCTHAVERNSGKLTETSARRGAAEVAMQSAQRAARWPPFVEVAEQVNGEPRCWATVSAAAVPGFTACAGRDRDAPRSPRRACRAPRVDVERAAAGGATARWGRFLHLEHFQGVSRPLPYRLRFA